MNQQQGHGHPRLTDACGIRRPIWFDPSEMLWNQLLKELMNTHAKAFTVTRLNTNVILLTLHHYPQNATWGIAFERMVFIPLVLGQFCCPINLWHILLKLM